MTDTDTLLRARNIALDTLAGVAAEIAALPLGNTSRTIELVAQLTTLQAGVKALDEAINTSRQYRPEFS
jgi:hypothetical protein